MGLLDRSLQLHTKNLIVANGLQVGEGVIDGYEEGYNKCLETNGNSDEDMLEFALYVATAPNTPYKTVKELLQIWKDQRPKIVYYGTN